jgi:hypothetical protein
MLTIRHFGERASADYLAGKIYGVVHCYIGEEVKASASAAPSTVATESSWHIAATATASPRPQPHDWRALRDARSGSENWTQHGRAQHRPGALRLVPRSAPLRHGGRAGFGLGFERTLAYVAGPANVRDAIPFPRTPGNAQY